MQSGDLMAEAVTVRVDVPAAPPPTLDPLPRTGADLDVLLLSGVALVLVGLAWRRLARARDIIDSGGTP